MNLKIMEKIPVWHIMPMNDSGTHLEVRDCKCKPKIEVLDDRVLITHNSFDGREAVEWENWITNKD